MARRGTCGWRLLRFLARHSACGGGWVSLGGGGLPPSALVLAAVELDEAMSQMITLKWYEAEQAIYVGARREAETIRKGQPVVCFSKQSSIDNHIQSAGAEKAVAVLLNLDWHASINEFKDGVADVGSRIEVRFRRNQWDLKVEKKDHDNRCYVLVWGELPTFEIVGWLWGRNAKHDCFWSNPGNKEDGWAYFVPAEHVRPIEELMEALARWRNLPGSKNAGLN